MAIMFKKGQNYSILKETFKVPVGHLENLKILGIILKVNDTSIALDNGKGLVEVHSFNTLSNNIVKNPQTKDIVGVNAFVSNYLILANQAASQAIPSEPKKAPIAPAYVAVSQADVDAMPVVKLRDAVALYQRVHGTSGGSIYRVVALNDKLKVAVRIKGVSVSIRIEGVLDSASVNAFSALGIIKHSDEYMSGHFNCEKCTPQKLIGSVLVGSGVAFNSPMPVISNKVFGVVPF
jgi:hypothetical protein